eukprot:Blabericola_migrator_1__6750@NODE_340_length_9604_cov_22_008284_g273_i0_p3_GENE_NODE_340_length_9604_cov_22_008284_g273_i0NODE_340_length_9604_cov_22_008284_g273_i0_p3_ORF_typecomplete_len104_score6_90_NODE_340_length_9604_cov_22_008284_g273_i058986209
MLRGEIINDLDECAASPTPFCACHKRQLSRVNTIGPYLKTRTLNMIQNEDSSRCYSLIETMLNIGRSISSQGRILRDPIQRISYQGATRYSPQCLAVDATTVD